MATSNNIGIEANGDGLHAMHAIKLVDGRWGMKSQAGGLKQGGQLRIFASQWAKLDGYYWDLPRAGKYTLISTVRTYATSAGWGKIKLGVDRVFSPASEGSKLLVDDIGDDVHGSSVRITSWYEKKIFSLMNQAARFSWEVEVTGPIRVILHGMKSGDGLGIGIQNDGNGFASTIWYQNEEAVMPSLKKE